MPFFALASVVEDDRLAGKAEAVSSASKGIKIPSSWLEVVGQIGSQPMSSSLEEQEYAL